MINEKCTMMINQFLLSVEIFYIGIIVSFPQAKGIYLACHFTQGTDEHSCETLQCLNVYVYECIKSIEIELVNENRCLN